MPSRVTPVLARWRRRIRRRAAGHVWLLALAAVATLVQALALARTLPGEQPPPLGDSIIFEYYGWYLARGARLYVDMWEVKPPLSYQTTAVLSLLSGGDQLLYHALSVALTNAAVVASVVLVGVLAAEVGGDARAGFVAGLAVYASPVAFVRATYGFKSKYFVVLAGLLAVLLLLRDRPLSGGVAAAAAVGYWQLAVVFPLVAVGLAVQRGGRRALARVAAGGAAMAALTLGPVVARGGLVPMLSQTVLAPLLVGGSKPLARRLSWLVELFQFGTVVALLGGAGVALAVASDRRRNWWLAVVWCWFAGHLVFVNFDYYADLLPLLFVNGVAVGALVGRLPDRLPVAGALPFGGGRTLPFGSGATTWPRSVTGGSGPSVPGDPGTLRRAPGRWLPLHPAVPVAGLVAALLVVNVATLGAVAGTGAHPVKEPGGVADPENVTAPYVLDEKRALLFEGLEPGTCHVFTGRRQRAWMNLTNGSRRDVVCDRLPPGYGWLAALGPATTVSRDPGGTSPGATATREPGTATPYPTLSPRPLVVVEDMRYGQRDDGTFVVTLPLRNEVGRRLAATVVVRVVAGGESHERRRTVTLAGDGARTVEVRFDLGDRQFSGLQVDVNEGPPRNASNGA